MSKRHSNVTWSRCDVDVVTYKYSLPIQRVVYLEVLLWLCCPFQFENLKIRRVSLFVRREVILEKFRGIPSTLLSPSTSPTSCSEAGQGYCLGWCRISVHKISQRSVRVLSSRTMSTLPPYSTYRTDSKVSEPFRGDFHVCFRLFVAVKSLHIFWQRIFKYSRIKIDWSCCLRTLW